IEKNDLSIESAYPFAPTYRSSQKHLYKLRKENLPPLPKERSDLIFEDDYARFTKHAWDYNEMHACVFIFLTNKTEDIYNKLLDKLKLAAEKLGFFLNPDLIVSDYEAAVINALKTKIFNASIKGCHFHYTQALWKNVRLIGLTNKYSENASIREWLNYFKSLPFVPFEELDNVFLQIKSIKPSESVSKLDEFISYFTRTWILHKIFTPFTWNHFNTEGPRTYNHVEGFNHKINNYIDNNHLHVYSAINTLKGLVTT
ncbi:unnamed protein product, partial [Brachionus calyciflorus]